MMIWFLHQASLSGMMFFAQLPSFSFPKCQANCQDIIAWLQYRYDGWVTEMQDESRRADVSGASQGIDNLLYSADACETLFALSLPSVVKIDAWEIIITKYSVQFMRKLYPRDKVRTWLKLLVIKAVHSHRNPVYKRFCVSWILCSSLFLTSEKEFQRFQ